MPLILVFKMQQWRDRSLGGQLIMLSQWALHPFSSCMCTSKHLAYAYTYTRPLSTFQTPGKSDKCKSINTLVMGFGEIYSIRHEIHPVKQTSYRARKQLVAPITFMPLLHQLAHLTRQIHRRRPKCLLFPSNLTEILLVLFKEASRERVS